MGNARQEDQFCAEVAAALGIVVAAVDYRLAPEHPFPTPLHDCYDALMWLADRPSIDRDRVAVGGASAGAGLAAALALVARDRGQVAPAFQLLRYPMLDDRTSVGIELADVDVRLWNHSSNRFGWESYLGRAPGGDAVIATAAPARAGDLTGLPPAWMGVGTLDLFIGEDVDYARRLAAAGVGCDISLVEGAFHGFDVVRPKAPVSRRFRAEQIDALRRALELARPRTGAPHRPPAGRARSSTRSGPSLRRACTTRTVTCRRAASPAPSTAEPAKAGCRGFG